MIGAKATSVRDQATTRAKEEKTGQLSLLTAPTATDSRYKSLHARALVEVPRDVLARLAVVKSIPFRELWPGLLAAHHIMRTELGQFIWKVYKKGEIRILNLKPGERSVKDEHVLVASAPWWATGHCWPEVRCTS